MKSLFVCVLLLLITLVTLSLAQSGSYPDTVILVDWTIVGDEIEITVTTDSNGWVATYLSTFPDPMHEADIYIGASKDGNFVIQNRHAIGPGKPGLAENPTVTLVSGSLVDNTITMTFRRPLLKPGWDLSSITTIGVARGQPGDNDVADDNFNFHEWHKLYPYTFPASGGGPGPAMAGPAGPVAAGPVAAGPGPAMAGPAGPVAAGPGPAMAGPGMAGPVAAGPGPAMAGPGMGPVAAGPGPARAGPVAAGPGPAMAGPVQAAPGEKRRLRIFAKN